MSDLTIREATAVDDQAIWDINLRAWSGYCIAELLEQCYGTLNGKGWCEHMAEAVGRNMKGKNVTTFVAEIDGAVVGYATGQISHEKPADTGTVGYNAVDPDYQRQGIGTALIQQVMDFLKEQGAKVLVVVTLVDDEPVRRIYDRLGFDELTR